MLGGVRSGAALAVVAPRLPFPRVRGGEGRGAGTRSSSAARQTHFVGQRGDWPAIGNSGMQGGAAAHLLFPPRGGLRTCRSARCTTGQHESGSTVERRGEVGEPRG